MAGALRLTSLTARGWRNLEPVNLEPGPRFNVFFGDNGQGKSNLLEAIDYLGTLRSFRGASAADLIREGSEQAELKAVIAAEPLPHHHRCLLPRRGARKVTLDDKRPRSKSAYFRSVQMVLFHPGDMQLVAGAPERRRAFLDRVLEQFDETYATTYSAYERALRSRNRLLKAERPNRAAIAAFDELLASAGAVVGQTRQRLVEEMAPLV